MSEKGFRVEIPVNIKRGGRVATNAHQETPDELQDGVPTIARLLALAHKWERMVREGEAEYAQLARRHGLSRARVSQVCSLTLLAPKLQQAILCSEQPQGAISMRSLQGNWGNQCNEQRRIISGPAPTDDVPEDRSSHRC